MNDGTVKTSGVATIFTIHNPFCTFSEISRNETVISGKCTELDEECGCDYSFGTAYHKGSEYHIEGEHRRFLDGIGRHIEFHGNASTDDGAIDCSIGIDPFGKQEYLDLDFYDVKASANDHPNGKEGNTSIYHFHAAQIE